MEQRPRKLRTGEEVPAVKKPPVARPTLREDSRTRARTRILQGSLSAVAEKGLEATTDDIARTSGVSRRTVFRHFPSHSDLVIATLIEIRRILDGQLPKGPLPGADVRLWLTESVITIHRLYRDVIGRAFWDLYIDQPGLSPEVALRIAGALQLRHRYARAIAADAWKALGAQHEPPSWVEDSFSMLISGFATNALPDCTPEETGRLSARTLWLVLMSALEEESPAGRALPAAEPEGA
jgi:AcrR family transcriptional regulator